MKDTIPLNNNARVVIEVLDNGSVIVTLEQRIGGRVMLDRTWQPVNFKRFGARNGFKINPPGAIAKLFGDTLEKRIRQAISKCRSVASRLSSIQSSVAKLIPQQTQSDAQTIEDLINLLARDLNNRFRRFERVQLTDERRTELALIFNQAIEYILMAAGLVNPLDPNIPVINIRNAPEEIRNMFDDLFEEINDIARNPPTPRPQPEPSQAKSEGQTSEETRRERIDDIIVHDDSHGSSNEEERIEEDETTDEKNPNS